MTAANRSPSTGSRKGAIEKRLVPFCLACILLHGAPANAGKPPAVLGDRQPQVEETYPEWLFVHKDEKNRVVDITQPPFNARGDGVHDDTKAFVKAYDYVLARMYGERSWNDDDVWRHRADEHLIYIPDGTYLVSDTLMYSGPLRGERKKGLDGEGWYGQPLYGIRLIGQSRDGTTIRLKDHCPGYGMKDGKPSGKVVVGFTQAQFNNWPSGNAIRNVTIDTGTGNPGAVGLNFHGANKCEIRNVTVRSRDRQGDTGILVRTGPTAGHFTDITVEGFRRGIAMGTVARATHVGWEYITLKHQTETGFLCDTSSTSIRHLMSRNAVPALRIREAGHVVLDRARLHGGVADKAALWIDSDQAQLFCEELSNLVDGYVQAALVLTPSVKVMPAMTSPMS